MSSEPQIRITRSVNRRRTVTARLIEDGTVLEILAPHTATDAELAPMIDRLRDRVLRKTAKRATADDAALARRASELNREYFEGKLRWSGIRYVTNQQRRYGSCTPATGAIRISHRVATLPAWVRDYILVHELAHLREANHGPHFWALVNRYPRTERARGYLMALGLESENGEGAEPDID